MKIDTLNNYGGTIQDIHDNTIYVAPNQTIIAAKKETVEAEEVNDEVIISNNEILDKGKPYFDRAIESGLMKQTANGYEWIASQVLLAYFCARSIVATM